MKFFLLALLWGAAIAGEYEAVGTVGGFSVIYNFRKDGACIMSISRNGQKQVMFYQWKETEWTEEEREKYRSGFAAKGLELTDRCKKMLAAKRYIIVTSEEDGKRKYYATF